MKVQGARLPEKEDPEVSTPQVGALTHYEVASNAVDPEDREYRIWLPHDAACRLIRGEVRQDVIVACISAIKALDDSLRNPDPPPKRRKKG